MEALINHRITECGDVGLRDSDESWRKIEITGFKNRRVHGVVEGVVVDVPLNRVYKLDQLTPVKRKDLKGMI